MAQQFMSNPAMMNMANNLASNPDMLNQMMHMLGQQGDADESGRSSQL